MPLTEDLFAEMYLEYLAAPRDVKYQKLVGAPGRMAPQVRGELPPLAENASAVEEAVKWWTERQEGLAGFARIERLHHLLHSVNRSLRNQGPPLRFDTPSGMLTLGQTWWTTYSAESERTDGLPPEFRFSTASRPFPFIRLTTARGRRVGTNDAFRARIHRAVLQDEGSAGALRFGLCVLGASTQARFAQTAWLDEGLQGFRGTEVVWTGSGGGSVAAELRACVEWARRMRIHVLCFPELSVDRQGRDSLWEEIERDPGALCVVIPGSFHEQSQLDGEWVNRAPVWLVEAGPPCRLAGHGGFEKTDPFNVAAHVLGPLFVGEVVPDGCRVFQEDIRPGTELVIVETQVGYMGVMICKDAMRGEVIEHYGQAIDHLVIVSMNERGTAFFWTGGGEGLAKYHGAASVYVNSLQSIPENDEDVDLAFACFPHRAGPRNRVYRLTLPRTKELREAGLPPPQPPVGHPDRRAEIHPLPLDRCVCIEIPLHAVLRDT